MYKHATVLSSLVIVSAFAGCVEVRYQPTPEFCTNARGDETCAELFPDGSRPYCVVSECLDDFYGCFPDVPGENCASPCGLENPECGAGGTTEGSGSGSESTTDGSESGSESGSTTGPQPCMEHGDCTDAGAPFCEPSNGECVACDGMDDPDGACAGLDPGAPLCVGGACVQCTAAAPEACTGVTPVCDDATNTCVPCTTHDQCGEAACNLFTGACLPGDAVVHVGPGQEYATLGAAVGSFDMMTEGTIVVHQANYDEAVTVDGGRVLALLANGGDTPNWTVIAGGSSQLEVTDGTVLLDGLRLSGNADNRGLVVTGGRAWVDRSRIVQNTGGGILAQGGAELVLRNCFAGGNQEAIVLDVQSATAEILYTTLGAGLGVTIGLICDPASTVTVRNSLIVSRSDDDEVVCNGLDASYSAAELPLGGTGNVALGTMQTTWFQDFNAGVFNLSGSHPAAIDTAAEWSTGDPPTDIEGDLRPTVDGTPDYAGADVP